MKRFVERCKPTAFTVLCRAANLATRWQMELSGTLNGGSSRLLPLGFPRGEAARLDGTSEPARLADEGWRWLKVLDFPVEWRKPEHMPLIQLHSFTNLSPPLISHNKNIGSEVPLFCCDSFPPGEAKNSITIRYYRSTKRSIAGASGRLLVDPYSGRVRSTGYYCTYKKGATIAVAPFILFTSWSARRFRNPR